MIGICLSQLPGTRPALCVRHTSSLADGRPGGIAKHLSSAGPVSRLCHPRHDSCEYRELITRNFEDLAKAHPESPVVATELERLMVQCTMQSPTRRYTRRVGVLDNLGHQVGRNTFKRIRRSHGVAPVPMCGKRVLWKTLFHTRWRAIAVADFGSAAVRAWSGFVRHVVLLGADLQTLQVQLCGVVRQTYGACMKLVARNLTDGLDGILTGKQYRLHDQDPLITHGFSWPGRPQAVLRLRPFARQLMAVR